MPRQNRKKRPIKPLTEAQKKAVNLMFNGERMGQIAAILGIHRTTLWRWSTRKDFQQEHIRVQNRYARERRRALIKEYHSSPEYKRSQNRKNYARQKLKKISVQLDKAQTWPEHQRLWKLYQKTYNDAFFDGKTVDEFLNPSRFSFTRKKVRKEPKYIIKIV